MTVRTDDVARALETFGSGTLIDVADESIGLLRYANSRVTAQHGEQRLRARVRTEREGRVAFGSIDTLEADAVRALAERMTIALHQYGAAEPPGPVTIGSAPPVGRHTEPFDAARRHALFGRIRDDLGDTALLGGAIRAELIDRVVAGSDGTFAAETLPKTSLQALASKQDRSASVRFLARDPDEISVDGVAAQLLADLAPLPERAVESGPCQVILRPQAANTLIATFGYVALGAAGYAAGRTAASGHMGRQLTSELITLVDDGHDPEGLPSGFDAEGTVRRNTPLVTRGELTGVVSDRARAHVTEGRSTGHGVPFGWRFGADPVPTHLMLEPGDATDADLVSSCKRGLLVSRLDYLRVLHPKDTRVTGTTRDATYWVENGRIVGRHPAVRLTFRLDEVLRAVLALGKQRERGEQPFIESVLAPAMLIDAGPIVL